MSATHKGTVDFGPGGLVTPHFDVRVNAAVLTGSASMNIDPSGLPATAMVYAADVACEQAATFSAGTTTGLGFTVGITTDGDGYLLTAAVTSMVAGQVSQLGGAGVLAGNFARNPTLRIVATATGGAADLDEVSGGSWLVRYYFINAAS
jgi:hypothetical protein